MKKQLFNYKGILRKGVALCSCLALASALCLTGCGSSSSSSSTQTTSFNLDGYDLDYTDRDLDPSYDDSAAVHVSLADDGIAADGSGVSIDGTTVTITAEGVYVVEGTLSNGQLVVDADGAKVQVVLNGVSITNQSGPAVYVKDAKKCFVTLADGTTNQLADAAGYTLTDDDGDEEPTAALFSKADLTLQGSGTLNITGNCENGICSKDDLVITGGAYTVTAVNDAIRGKDCVKIKDGTFSLTSGQDAVKSNNDSDEYEGFVLIDGGTFTINAGDDAVHGETLLVVNDGTVDVKSCYEGYEAPQIYINGSTTHIVASDDGLNAATGSNSDAQDPSDVGANHMQDKGMGPDAQSTTKTASASTGLVQTAYAADMGSMDDDESCFLQINGGYLVVDAGGDGLDSNGSFEMTGGTVLVNGPSSSADGALDYGGEATISGGTIIAVGASGMAEGFTSGDQGFALLSASGSAGQTVAVTDADGNVLVSMTATKSFQSVVVSTPDMVNGQEYSLVVGDAVEGANEDGYAQSGTVSSGSAATFTAGQSSSSAFDARDMGSQMSPDNMPGNAQGGSQPGAGNGDGAQGGGNAGGDMGRGGATR